jgi:hypothetical protein
MWKNKEKPTTETKQVVAYTVGGREVPETDKDVYAKKTTVDGRPTIYWILIGSDGHLYNPFGLDGNSFHKNKRFNRSPRQGVATFVFEKVSEDVFSYYLNFLTTRTERWLRYANRKRD